MKKVIIGLFLLMVTLVFMDEKDSIIIPENAIRFRIIANSNNENDQQLKHIIKDDVEEEIYKLIKVAKNTEEARNIITSNLDRIDGILKKYNVNYDINYGSNFFPQKTYKGIEYPEGEYESLVITLGQGIGKNWWCVLFPPLCLLDEESNIDDVEYKFYAEKLINKLK